jgi:HrpA-like RNA helicase
MKDPFDVRSEGRAKGNGHGPKQPIESLLSRTSLNGKKSHVDFQRSDSLSDLNMPAREIPSESERQAILRKQLPVAAYEQQILEAVRDNDSVIIVAETGAGKTTQVIQFLLDYGYSSVGTQPRRIACSSVAHWVAFQRGEELGKTIGFRHALGGVSSPESRAVFTTDGYELSYVLANRKFQADVLVLDEVHEANPNMEALLALWKKWRDQGNAPKLVVMSATMNAERLAQYLGTSAVIDIPGRTFPVVELPKADSMLHDVIAQVALGRNCLVFLPGKNEIGQLEDELHNSGIDAEIIPLHGLLSKEEQDRAFHSYTRPKVILATNVAQTSITVDDVDCVIDSGLERQLFLVDGTESLLIQPISQHDVQQRKGRAGRTKPGFYIYHGETEFAELLPEAIPAIERVPVDTLMLRLIAGGEDIERLDFLHTIPEDHIEQAHELLYLLNLIGPQGHITERGRLAAKLPVKARIGKMIAHAVEHWPDDLELLGNILIVAAISEAQGITANGMSKRWKQFCPHEQESDHIAQLLVYLGARSVLDADARLSVGRGEGDQPIQLDELGVDRVSFRRAEQVEKLLRTRMDIFELEEGEMRRVTLSDSMRRKILECVWSAHVDTVYELKVSEGRDSLYRSVHGGDLRKLGRESVVQGQAKHLVGKAFDLAVLREDGEPRIVELLLMASKIDPEWLAKHRPARLKRTYDELARRAREPERRRRADRLPSRGQQSR